MVKTDAFTNTAQASVCMNFLSQEGKERKVVERGSFLFGGVKGDFDRC